MRCEECKKAKATVHITQVVADAPGGMKKHDLCEACFSQSDLAKEVSCETAGWEGYSAAILPDDESGANFCFRQRADCVLLPFGRHGRRVAEPRGSA